MPRQWIGGNGLGQWGQQGMTFKMKAAGQIPMKKGEA
jgi:hypothetical protein